MRFGDSRVQALAGALCVTLCAVTGITNRSLRALMTGLLGAPYTMTQASYDLARLRRNGLITRRIEHANTYDLTPDGTRSSPSSTPRSTTGSWPRCSPPASPRHRPQLRAALRTIEQHIDDQPRPRQAASRQPENSAQLSEARRHKGSLRSVRDFARKEWPLRGSSADVSVRRGPTVGAWLMTSPSGTGTC